MMLQTALPTCFKAAQISEKGGKFEIVDMPWKNPNRGEIIIKVLACGVCHSDSVVKDQHMPTGLPRVPGHEIIGDVVQVGEGETLWKVGDRVGGGWHGGHCRECNSCRSGDFVTCEKQNINGVITDGGYAEYCTLRTESVVRVPTSIDPAEAAPLLCAGVTTFNSVRNMNVKPGDLVAVQGIGGLGHLGIQFCRAMGFKTVALSSSASKKMLAKNLGAHFYIDGSKEDQAQALQKLGGAKVILLTAPNNEIMSKLMGGLAVNGQLVLLAVVPELKIPTLPMVMKRLSVRAWPSGSAKDSEECVLFAEQSGVKCQVEKFPLDRANDAYEAMITNKARFRAVIVP